MTRRFFPVAGALLTLCFVSGCVTSTLKVTPADPGAVSSKGSPVVYSLSGMNSGVYLFYWIPLWTGNPRNPNERDYDILSHRINEKAIYRMFDSVNRRRHTDGVEDVTVEMRSSGVWTLWILWKRSVHGRGVLIRGKSSKREKKR